MTEREAVSGIHEYLEELDRKIAKLREVSADTPRIGIFWLYLNDGKVQVFFSIVESLEFGQDYGDYVVSTKEHYVLWENLKRHKLAPLTSQYEDLPRGRVAYDKSRKQYVVFHGKYITAMPGIKETIKSEFKLKSNTRWESDLHYHGFKRWGF